MDKLPKTVSLLVCQSYAITDYSASVINSFDLKWKVKQCEMEMIKENITKKNGIDCTRPSVTHTEVSLCIWDVHGHLQVPGLQN